MTAVVVILAALYVQRLVNVRAASSFSGMLFPTTRTLDAAIAKLATLPHDEQDRVGRWLLDELRDDDHWARQFAASQDILSKLAAEARADLAAGRATPLDAEKL